METSTGMIALMLILIAGVINGSFALPTKHVKKWQFENVWLQYAIWAFLIAPWVIAYFMVPQITSVYAEINTNLLWIMILGGFIMGAGQVCFALAMNMIGLGLGFVINLGIGILLGFLLPLIFQHPDQISSPFGVVTLLGCFIAIIGLIFSHKAGKLHHSLKSISESERQKHSKHYNLGVLLAILAGLSSAGQNFSFSMTEPMQQVALAKGASSVGASIVMWPGFLLCTFIPYALYMIYLIRKNNSFSNFKAAGTGKYYLFGPFMGLCWYGSLIFYSKATNLIGSLGPLVGWPLFMIFIILTSNFWGWRSKEWEGSTSKVRATLWIGLSLLIIAVIVLGYSNTLHS